MSETLARSMIYATVTGVLLLAGVLWIASRFGITVKPGLGVMIALLIVIHAILFELEYAGVLNRLT